MKSQTLAAILLSGFLGICSYAQNEPATANASASALSSAQKSYVAGNWKEAATAYAAACPKEPQEKQAECWLWNVLALSQTGDAKLFKEAGKRLDSLIQVVNPQQSLYSDLLMTSAQFRLYLGKYDKAAEALIQAIETAHPHQYVVLQKVCQAVKSKHHSENLLERCESLSNPKPTTDTVVEKKAEPTAAVAPVSSSVQSSASMASPAPVEEQKIPAAEQKTAATQPQPPAEEFWVLQLGAFGVKDNATLLVSTLKKRKIQANIVEQPRGEKILYLVQSGHFSSKEEAVDFGAKQLAPLKVEFQPLLRK